MTDRLRDAGLAIVAGRGRAAAAVVTDGRPSGGRAIAAPGIDAPHRAGLDPGTVIYFMLNVFFSYNNSFCSHNKTWTHSIIVWFSCGRKV